MGERGGSRKPTTPNLARIARNRCPLQTPDPTRVWGPGLGMSLDGTSFQLPGFGVEETEAQRGEGPCQRSHGLWRAEQKLNPRLGPPSWKLPSAPSPRALAASLGGAGNDIFPHKPENHGLGLAPQLARGAFHLH